MMPIRVAMSVSDRTAILVVGDEDLFSAFLKRFSPDRYQVLFAPRVVAALAHCDRYRPRLLVVDSGVGEQLHPLLHEARRAQLATIAAANGAAVPDELRALVDRVVDEGPQAVIAAASELLEERRRAPRAEIDLPLQIAGHGRARATACSPHALFVASDSAPPLQTPLEITLETERGPISGSATVSRVGPGRGGQAGMVLSIDDSAAELRRYLSQLTRRRLVLGHFQSSDGDALPPVIANDAPGGQREVLLRAEPPRKARTSPAPGGWTARTGRTLPPPPPPRSPAAPGSPKPTAGPQRAPLERAAARFDQAETRPGDQARGGARVSPPDDQTRPGDEIDTQLEVDFDNEQTTPGHEAELRMVKQQLAELRAEHDQLLALHDELRRELARLPERIRSLQQKTIEVERSQHQLQRRMREQPNGSASPSLGAEERVARLERLGVTVAALLTRVEQLEQHAGGSPQKEQRRDPTESDRATATLLTMSDEFPAGAAASSDAPSTEAPPPAHRSRERRPPVRTASGEFIPVERARAAAARSSAPAAPEEPTSGKPGDLTASLAATTRSPIVLLVCLLALVTLAGLGLLVYRKRDAWLPGSWAGSAGGNDVEHVVEDGGSPGSGASLSIDAPPHIGPDGDPSATGDADGVDRAGAADGGVAPPADAPTSSGPKASTAAEHGDRTDSDDLQRPAPDKDRDSPLAQRQRYMERGERLLQRGKHEAARSTLVRALRIKDSRRVRLLLARANDGAKKPAAALKHLKRAVRRTSGKRRARLLGWIGRLHERLDHTTKACRAYRSASELAPKDRKLSRAAARVCKR